MGVEQTTTDVDEAFAAIVSANLSPTEHLLLKAFVNEAVDPSYAAQHILQRLKKHSKLSAEEVLRGFKQDWRRLVVKFRTVVEVQSKAEVSLRNRDGPHCCMLARPSRPTGTSEAAFIIPPTLFEDHELHPQGSLFSLMEAFLTPEKVSQLGGILGDIGRGGLRNLWLLSPSFHSAFRDGRIRFQPIANGVEWNDEDEVESPNATKVNYIAVTMWPEECTNLVFSDGSLFHGPVHMFDIHTPDPILYPLPSPVLLRVHFRFASALHLFFVEERVSEGWPRIPLVTLGTTTQKVLRKVWHFVPKALRVLSYLALSKIGQSLYNDDISRVVQRMPFGLCLKQCVHSQENEGNALLEVERYTTVPAPLFVDSFQRRGDTFLVMTRLRGLMLNRTLHRMSYSEREQFACDLRDVVTQIQRIPNRTPYLIANTSGGSIMDHRLPHKICGPFDEESDFNAELVRKYVGAQTKKLLAPIHSRQHRSVFTHSDLSPNNILIEGGRLSGIVDWECAGYFPEYWEFTKAMFSTRDDRVKEDLIRSAFGNNFEDELQAEQTLWRITPLF